jgi:hypothetical protein
MVPSQGNGILRTVTDTECPRHSGAPAVGTCERCGTFVCAQDVVLLANKRFCTDCSKRPDVDYLEAFRLKYWGKRDGWAWAFGIGGLVNGLAAVSILVGALSRLGDDGPKDLPGLLVGAFFVGLVGANGVAFWLGKPFARWGVALSTLFFTGSTAFGIAVGGVGKAGFAEALLLFVAISIIPVAIVVNIFTNWRTQLFFKLEVPRPKLQAAWDLLHNNTLARQSVVAGIVGLIVPGFCLIALLIAVIAYRRVDPNAFPPIGKKGYAIAGLVFGALGTLEWVAVAIATGFR